MHFFQVDSLPFFWDYFSMDKSNKNIKAIISDLDGVIRYFPENRNSHFEQIHSIPSGTIMSCAFEHEDLYKVIRGKITDQEWRRNIATRLSELAPEVDSKKIVEEWSDFSGVVNNQVLDVLKKMKRDRPLVLMTNATDKLPFDLKQLGIYSKFDIVINSSELGFAKPENEIFEFALDKLSLKPEEVVFIDDSEKIISKAKDLGFQSHHCKSFEDFESFCISVL